jgi:hypothetical protein
MKIDAVFVVVLVCGYAAWFAFGVYCGAHRVRMAAQKSAPVLHIPQIRGVAEMSDAEISLLIDRIAENVDVEIERMDDTAALATLRPPYS